MEAARTLEFHPIANQYPLMDGDDFTEFVAHMRAAGYDPLQPIYLYEAMILDGRNRYRACSELNIAPVLKDWAGEWGTPERFVRKVNYHRTHYTKEQRALLAAREHEESFREKGSRRPFSKKTVKEVAEANGVSESDLKRAKKVMKRAVPEVKKLVESGQARLLDAANVAALPEEVQRDAAKRVVDGEARTLTEGAAGDAHEQDEPAEAGHDPMDHEGNVLPAEMRGVFKTAIFADCIENLHQARTLIKTLTHLTPYLLDANQSIATISSIEQKVKNSAPYSKCPACKGKRCDACRREGWVPEWRFVELVAEQVSMEPCEPGKV